MTAARADILEGCKKIETERREPHVEIAWIAIGPGGILWPTCALTHEMAEGALSNFLKSRDAQKNCRIVKVRIEEVLEP
jgi:hypothetical protein